MSIHDEIKARIGEERLFLVEPAVLGDPVKRYLIISQEIKSLLEGPWVDEKHEQRIGRLIADLDSFVTGGRLSVCLTPFEAGKADLGRLDRPHDEVWDLRNRDEPGLRIFGRFADVDTFVALTWSPRSVPILWALRVPLENNLRNWRNQIVQCKTEWTNLFATYQPQTGDTVHAYLSSNVVLV